MMYTYSYYCYLITALHMCIILYIVFIINYIFTEKLLLIDILNIHVFIDITLYTYYKYYTLKCVTR